MTGDSKVESLLKALALTQRELEIATNMAEYYKGEYDALKSMLSNKPNGSEA